MNRRGFLEGILAAGVAPSIIRVEWLMPIRPIGEHVLDESFRTFPTYHNLGVDFTPLFTEEQLQVWSGELLRMINRPHFNWARYGFHKP